MANLNVRLRFAQIMPKPEFPAVCGARSCSHLMCLRWRENFTRRCSNCEEFIQAGQRFIEYRDPVSKNLISQEHEVCPVKVA